MSENRVAIFQEALVRGAATRFPMMRWEIVRPALRPDIGVMVWPDEHAEPVSQFWALQLIEQAAVAPADLVLIGLDDLEAALSPTTEGAE